MKIDGLWIITFVRYQKKGQVSGAAVFRDGLILGGDGELFYIGEYEQTNEKITGSIDIAFHSKEKHPELFFGKHQNPIVEFTLEKEKQGPFQYVGDGKIRNPVDSDPQLTIAIRRAVDLSKS